VFTQSDRSDVHVLTVPADERPGLAKRAVISDSLVYIWSTRGESGEMNAELRRHLLTAAACVALGASPGAYGTAWAAPKAAAGSPSAKLLECSDALKESFRPDALTSVVAVRQFRKGDALAVSEPVTAATPKAQSDLCMVKLLVGPGNPGPADAPSTTKGIGIEVFLPSREAWNGRLHNIGGRGGYDGGDQSLPNVIGWPHAAAVAGSEGAISASTDSGHVPFGSTDWAMNPDGTPNRQAWLDFSHRAQHETAAKTKALALAFYGRLPDHSYYEGASTGGRHGYQLAQMYPDDYDGIIANLPTIYFENWANWNFYKGFVTYKDLGGVKLSEEQQDLVSNAAIHACDVVGGEHLGYIFDNAACRYDPTKDPGVLCKSAGGRNTTKDCVTSVQATAFNKWWYGQTTDGSVPSPAEDNGTGVELKGKRLWYGTARGTSLYLAYFTKLNKQLIAMLAKGNAGAASASGRSANAAANAEFVALALQNPTLAGPGFKNATGNGKDLWTLMSYEQVANAFERGVAMDRAFAGVSSANPDLSAFKARGGKFLSWHGWNDESIPVQHTMHYYDQVAAKMGGYDSVGSFFKLYLIPGGGHTSPHGTSNIDANPPAVAPGQMYQLMLDWVEKGIAPARVEGTSPNAERPRISQPFCAYPQKATYLSGDPKASSSFQCR
jgi:hypothetical protein